MNKLEILKGATTLVVGSSVNSVVKALLKGNIVANDRLGEAQLTIGTMILSGMAASQANGWALSKIDRALEAWEAYQKSQEVTTAE
jgi:hypothetical protein